MAIELPNLPNDERHEEESLTVGSTTIHIIKVWDVYRDVENDEPYEQYAGERVYVTSGEGTALVYVDDEQVF